MSKAFGSRRLVTMVLSACVVLLPADPSEAGRRRAHRTSARCTTACQTIPRCVPSQVVSCRPMVVSCRPVVMPCPPCPPPCPCPPCPEPPGPTDPPEPPACPRVRPNIASLTSEQLASLRKGVEVMKARSVSDPTSWAFQANIHGTFDAPPDPLWNQCQHGTIHFLTWHRGYVYYFERILRKAANDESLDLPYWDWTTAPSLPEAFRMPADASNPLYDATRAINDGSSLNPLIVVNDKATALALIPFYNPFPSFSRRFEASPHGAVHIAINGNMSLFETAGQDPIFWLHHCNIDRVWDEWLNLAGGRLNPNDDPFLDTEFSFADENGQTVTHKVRELLYSSDLCYRYEDMPNPPQPASRPAEAAAVHPSPSEPADEHEHSGDEEAAPAGEIVATSAVPEGDDARVKLGLEDSAFPMAVPEAKLNLLRTAVQSADVKRKEKLVLHVRGVEFSEIPAFTYGVFVNLPDKASEKESQRYYVGVLNFFARRPHGADRPATDKPVSFDERFDLTSVVQRLRDDGKWTDKVVVTLRPVTSVPPEGQEEAARARTTASAEKAKMSLRTLELRLLPAEAPAD